MINLRRTNVEVNNETEHEIAQEFYKRACKLPVHPVYNYFGFRHKFVGVHNGDYTSINTVNTRFKTNTICTGIPLPFEKSIPFSQIETLTDTDSRRSALNQALKKFGYNDLSEVNKSKPDISVTKEESTSVSPKLPLVRFDYEKDNNDISRRMVRVVKMTGEDLYGFEVSSSASVTGTFKRFKVDRCGPVKLVQYTP